MAKRERCPDCHGKGEIEIAGTQHTYHVVARDTQSGRGQNSPALFADEQAKGDFSNVVNVVKGQVLYLDRGIVWFLFNRS